MILDRLAPILVASLCLAGCAASPSLAPDYIGRYPGYEPVSDATVPSGAPIASLPASAGSVLSIRNMSFSNGLRQVIVLEGPAAMTGENTIVVEALTPPMVGVASGNDLRLAPPSDTEIQSELAKLFPTVAMQISGDVEHGPQGSFGYASGKSGGLNCLYAWEYLAPRRPLTLLEGASGTGVYPASVRVRLCRAEPLADLLADMHRLTVTPPGGSRGITARVAQAPDPSREDALDAAVGPLGPASGRRDSDLGATSRPSCPRRPGASPRQRRFARHEARPRSSMPLLVGRSSVPPVPLPGDLTTGAASRPPPRRPPHDRQPPRCRDSTRIRCLCRSNSKEAWRKDSGKFKALAVSFRNSLGDERS